MGAVSNAMRMFRTYLIKRKYRTPETITRALTNFTGVSSVDSLAHIWTFLRTSWFFNEFNEKYIQERHIHGDFSKSMYPMLYALVRIVKPSVVVETGVLDGKSSAVILLAMHHNAKGRLYSIDKPAYGLVKYSTEGMHGLPHGRQPGWPIPDRLTSRHTILLGDSSDVLDMLAMRQHFTYADMFLHDSLHTFKHQWMEYSKIWYMLRTDGYLLSDDIYASNAFRNFARSEGREYSNIGNFGIMKK